MVQTSDPRKLFRVEEPAEYSDPDAFRVGDDRLPELTDLMRRLKSFGYYAQTLVPQQGIVKAAASVRGHSRSGEEVWDADIRLFPEKDDEIGASISLAHVARDASRMTGFAPVGTASVVWFSGLRFGAGGMAAGLFFDAAKKAHDYVWARS